MPRRTNATVERRKYSSTRQITRITSAFKFVDPYPEIHGTLPEKMVYAELSRLGIPFLFLNDIHFVIPEIQFDKWYQADFVIPSLKLIIEVNGAHWHSMEKTIESDAFKYAIYETAGYRVLAWWDYDIIERLHDLVFAEPQLLSAANFSARYGKSTELAVQRRTKVDTSKGIRTLNQKRRRQPSPKISKRKLKKGLMSYATR